MTKTSQSDIVNMLWTGGWDSTFCLLQFVLEEKKVVQPYYLIDPNRQSLRQEIKAMRIIKERIYKDFPDSKGKILPIRFKEIMGLMPDNELTEAFGEVNAFRNLATQYLWFAWFCKGEGINDMELSTEHKEDETNACLFRYFLTQIGETSKFRVADEFIEQPFGILFKAFRFPIFGYSKQGMKEKAEKAGWMHIMQMTWFCHFPVHDRIPCGYCTPCTQATEEGFAWRIPIHRRILRAVGFLRVKQFAGKLLRKVYPNFHA